MNLSSNKTTLPSVLVIAGFDPSGGAGLLADTKTIHANGGYACSVISAITVQNTQGVQKVEAVESKLFGAQLKALAEDIQFDAIKIGMLANLEQVEILSEFLAQNTKLPVVLDPVLVSSSGHQLLADNALISFLEDLMPKATLLTPNLPEVKFLLERTNTSNHVSLEKLDISADSLRCLKTTNILVKGGHGTEDKAEDILFSELQTRPHSQTFCAPRLEVTHNHGTGCTLASAIATHLASGKNLPQAIQQAKNYVHHALQTADFNQPNYQLLPAGKIRHGSLNHCGNIHYFADSSFGISGSSGNLKSELSELSPLT